MTPEMVAQEEENRGQAVRDLGRVQGLLKNEDFLWFLEHALTPLIEKADQERSDTGSGTTMEARDRATYRWKDLASLQRWLGEQEGVLIARLQKKA